MKSIIVLLILGFSFNLSAACYSTSSSQKVPAFDKICLDIYGRVELYKEGRFIFGYTTTVQFSAAHDIYRQGKVEGHWQHIEAANHFSNSSNNALNIPGLEVRISLLSRSDSAHGGCTGTIWTDTEGSYCFYPDDPLPQ